MRIRVCLCALLAVFMALGALPVLAEETAGEPEVITSGDYEYAINQDGTVSIHAYNGSESELTIPSSLDGHLVTEIGDFAFGSSSGPASIIIPEGVTSIGRGAFGMDANLRSVVIPASVTSIGLGAFVYCIRLKAIEVSADNPCFASIDGVLFDKAAKTLLFYPCGKSAFSYQIPSGTVAVGESTFTRCDRLTSVGIPDSVLSIGAGAFTGCEMLSTIVVSEKNPVYVSIDNVLFDKAKNTLLAYPNAKRGANYKIPAGTTAIGEAAFDQCHRLTNVVIPDSVRTIGHMAFWGCRGLASIVIPDGVTSISDYAFANCIGFTSVSIPDSVTSFGDAVFSGCSKLSEIVVSRSNPIYESRDGVLFTKLTKILKFSPPARSAKDYEIPWDTTAIGNHAFIGNGNLTSVVIPFGVTSIGDYAFTMCDKLISITIPDSVTSIGADAFDRYKVNFRFVSDSYAQAYLQENDYIAE